MKAGLLGRKLGHSLSPQIHRLFGDHEYRLHECEPDAVEGFLRTGFAVGGFDFLNVTIPYKQTAFALCDEVTPLARRLGNVNLLLRGADGRILGDNTDAFGVERLLDSLGADVRGRRCAVLGAGGAAMTAKAVLEERGAATVSLVRRGELPERDDWLIVNATPVGMHPDVNGVRIDVASFPGCAVVLDLVYNPSPTRLVREARACGKQAADGMVMLIAQAYRAFALAVAQAADAQPLPRNIFLYGPPASGKTTLARQVSSATGLALADLDAEIVRREGRSIPDIFVADGERGFRVVERRELQRVAQGRGQVIALGGGALLDPENRALAERSGRVVVLDCPAETLKARLTGADRPLSANAAELEALLAERRAHYAAFSHHVDLSAAG